MAHCTRANAFTWLERCALLLCAIRAVCNHFTGFRLWYHRVPKFFPMAQCVAHALKGLAHAVVTKTKYFSMDPKLGYPVVQHFCGARAPASCHRCRMQVLVRHTSAKLQSLLCWDMQGPIEFSLCDPISIHDVIILENCGAANATLSATDATTVCKVRSIFESCYSWGIFVSCSSSRAVLCINILSIHCSVVL